MKTNTTTQPTLNKPETLAGGSSIPNAEPGEWKALPKYTDRQAVPIGVKREDGAWNIIGEAHGHDCHANAQRMASAPKLAEALRRLEAAVTAHQAGLTTAGLIKLCSGQDQARVALAQWEGGEK